MQADAGKWVSPKKIKSQLFWKNFSEPTEQDTLRLSVQSEGEVAASGLPYHWGNGRMPSEPLAWEASVLYLGILLQLIYWVTWKAATFEQDPENEKTLQQIQPAKQAAQPPEWNVYDSADPFMLKVSRVRKGALWDL